MKYALFFIALLIAHAFGYLVYPEDTLAGTTLGVVIILLMESIDSNWKNLRN